MHFGMSLPNFNAFSDPQVLAQMAHEAEEAGWEAFFLWDHIRFDDLGRPVADPWVALAGAAMNTRRIRLGTMLTPLARRRPWKLARETVTLDRLSGGRVTLGAGLGEPAQWEFGSFGEEADARIRAEKLDEGLEILTGLWSGEPFHFAGKHYQLNEMTFLPTPLQVRESDRAPHIPIWIGGFWPNKRPFRRAARYDGIFALGKDALLSPDNWREILTYIRQQRTTDEPFDAVHVGVTPGSDPAKAEALIAAYQAAGVTWWLEDISPYAYGLAWDQPWSDTMVENLRNRIRQGPPQVE